MKGEKPVISIIVPVYNVENTLCRCIDSILIQSYTDYELILVDDGSTDKSAAICDEYAKKDSRIVVTHKENGGVSSARNYGLEIAKGEYIAFADSDDEVGPDWLSNFAENIGESDICISGIIRISESRVEAFPDMNKDRTSIMIDLIRKNLFGYLFTKLYRRSVIEHANLRFDTTLRWREDELFNSMYFEHIDSISIVQRCDYIYYMPDARKNYGGVSATQCAVPLLQSYKRIFHDDIPVELCRLQAWTVKGEVERLMLSGLYPSSELINIYKYIFCKKLKSGRSYSERFLDFIVVNSHKLGFLSIWSIRMIHKVIS